VAEESSKGEPRDDEAARRARAAELREELEQLKTGEKGEPERAPSPREFTDRTAREEFAEQQDPGPDQEPPDN
jgi:hypothetical protein